MKLLSNKLFKISLIVAIVVTVVGMVFLGIFGFNQTVDYNGGYEVSVSVNQSSGNTLDVTEKATNDFFNSKGLKASSEVKIEGSKLTLVYKFGEDVTEKCAGLVDAVQGALNSEAEIQGLTATVNFDKGTVGKIKSDFGWILLATAIASVILFVYLLFIEKFTASVSVIAGGVISAILYIALMNITRVPLNPVGGAVGVFSYVLSTVLSVVMVNRFNEIKKNTNENLDAYGVVEKGTKLSLFRIIFISAIIMLCGILLLIIGPNYLRFLGLQIIIANVTSVFASYIFMPAIYALISGNKKN